MKVNRERLSILTLEKLNQFILAAPKEYSLPLLSSKKINICSFIIGNLFGFSFFQI